MKILPFKESAAYSIGVELEFQIIDPQAFSLASCAHTILDNINDSANKIRIKPEVTQSMIELNTSVHQSPAEMLTELIELEKFLLEYSKNVNVLFCGGGTHPFEEWTKQKIFPSSRYEQIAKKFGYLCQRATVFGQHVHIGCSNGDDAIYLTHALARYAPQFLAMCAASPFYQGVDTQFSSSRATIFTGFPMSGMMPFFMNWQEFSEYFYKLYNAGIIKTMKDVYWDIRPKPEFGTVEVRVCDTPLTLKKAVEVAAYIQALSAYLLAERPFEITPDIYYLYGYNRFQASRFGCDGVIIDCATKEKVIIADDILQTVKTIQRYANPFNAVPYLIELVEGVIHKKCDATLLRQVYEETQSLSKVVEEQCKIWSNLK